MRAISLKCPNCHANLEAAETAHSIKCTYCGTQARVQHRTRYLERKIALPPPRPAERKMPVAKQRHGWRWISLVSSIVPLAAAGLGVYFAVEQVGGIDKVGDALSQATDAVIGNRWAYGGKGNALLHDVNGDGHLDVIGTTRYVQNDDSYHLAAFDGRGGQRLWESESFGNHDDAIAGKTILHGNALVQGDSRGNMAGYAVITGLQLWKVPVGEKLKSACADDEVSLALELNDKSWKRILLKDGTLMELEGEPENCKHVAMHMKFGQRHLEHSSQNHRRRRPRLKLDGMDVRDLVTLVDEQGQQVALGNKSPGTRIPMLAYLRAPLPDSDDTGDEDAAKKKRKSRRKARDRAPKPALVWSSELPALDPLATKEGPPEFVAISQGYIASIYSSKEGSTHLVCFTREGGQRLWDVILPGRTSVITGIDIASDRVYVSQWGRLDAFEIERGSRVFSLGN